MPAVTTCSAPPIHPLINILWFAAAPYLAASETTEEDVTASIFVESSETHISLSFVCGKKNNDELELREETGSLVSFDPNEKHLILTSMKENETMLYGETTQNKAPLSDNRKHKELPHGPYQNATCKNFIPQQVLEGLFRTGSHSSNSGYLHNQHPEHLP
ncbi:hypothetical protein EG329_009371 [Mollisiaceae sp. DMI_Dod_QoI]|nr:hypothetical protein EG329_009371 [Helotiales sp. DMI_Dod_QoI]